MGKGNEEGGFLTSTALVLGKVCLEKRNAVLKAIQKAAGKNGGCLKHSVASNNYYNPGKGKRTLALEHYLKQKQPSCIVETN